MKYLKLRGNVWWYQRRIPENLRHFYDDKTMLSQSLNTSDIREAKHKRDILNGEIAGLKIKSINPETTKFRQIVNTLTTDKKEHPNEWDLAYDLEGIQRKGDRVFIDAYKTVTGKHEVPERYRYSLRESMNDWLNKFGSSKSADTIHKIPQAVEKFLKYLGEHDVSLGSINKRQAHDYLEMLESRYAKSTCYGFLSRLRGLWNYAESLGHVEGVNPFNGHKAVKAREVDKKQLLTPDEHSEIQKHVNNESLAMQLLYDLCLYTGCRVSEATGLLKRHIVQEGDITAIFIEKGKTSSATRTVPITQDIATRLSILIENKDDDDPILGIEAKVASRRFSRIKTRYITEDSSKSLHSLRALFATACQRAGIDELYASQLLGHSRGSTMTYGYYARGSTLIKLNVAYEKAVEEIHKYIN